MTDHANASHSPALQYYISLRDHHRVLSKHMLSEVLGEQVSCKGEPLYGLWTLAALVWPVSSVILIHCERADAVTAVQRYLHKTRFRSGERAVVCHRFHGNGVGFSSDLYCLMTSALRTDLIF